MKALTIDLEDWFQVYNMTSRFRFEDWHQQDSRIEGNTLHVLKILENYDTKATFFVLGWIAEKYPSLITSIKDQGHEIACHGYSHQPIFQMTKEEFEEDTDKALHAITEATGQRPLGYRAPSFSITKQTLWALEILKEKGFKYDSSMMPTRHPDYGIKGIPNKPFEIRGILEIPMTAPYGLPVGGGYFRAYPYWLTKHLINKQAHTNFYIHPWEFDPGMPKLKLPLIKSFRHYNGLKTTEKKFRKLLKDFRFDRLDRIIRSLNISA